MEGKKIATVKIKDQVAQIGRPCEICGGFIPDPMGKSSRSLCEECCKRLKKLLYSDLERTVKDRYE